jgi:hypothetical protein
VLEKFVMRAVRKRQQAGEEPTKKKDAPTTLTSKGGEVDL